MQRVIVGKGISEVQDIPPQQEAAIRAEWAKAEAEAIVEARKSTAQQARLKALEAVLDRLFAQNGDLKEVKDYLDLPK
jgi:biotin-(acetyl-CoA carboxylase) ligase